MGFLEINHTRRPYEATNSEFQKVFFSQLYLEQYCSLDKSSALSPLARPTCDKRVLIELKGFSSSRGDFVERIPVDDFKMDCRKGGLTRSSALALLQN
jgi:hypothetical protein